MQTRSAYFAGNWYPSDGNECRKTIEAMRPTVKPALERPFPIGGIVPHAGWYFSGELACRVFRQLAVTDPPDLMVIFGTHMGPRDSGRIMTHGEWETPLGALPVADEFAAAIQKQCRLAVDKPATAPPDNTIELQLPIIRYFRGAMPIVPISLPPTLLAIEVGMAVAALARERRRTIQIIGSTDLTHYGPNYGFTPRGVGPQAVAWVRQHNDRDMIEAVLALDPQAVLKEAVKKQNSCCAGAVAGAVAAARKLGAAAGIAVDYATSYDKQPGDSFVGYLAAIFK